MHALGRFLTTRNWHPSIVNKMALRGGGEACGVVVEGEGMSGRGRLQIVMGSQLS